MNKKKIFDLLLFMLFYVVAYIIGFLSCMMIDNLILKLLVFDCSATVIIWIFSLVMKNSSVYDAYWSLTPMIMLIYLLVVNIQTLNVFHYILAICFFVWSIRLTINWITTFDDRKWEDWRYKMYRANNSPIIWHIINFFGIQMMPTLLVFAGFIPLIILFTIEANGFVIIGGALILIGTAIEFLADRQMHAFLKTTKEKKVCKEGLWKHSRHPNYLGEITIWLGVDIALLLTDVSKWLYCLGFILMIALFEFISIPMMEKRQITRRPDYMEYQKSTSRLLILPNRK